jgi:hypothetical protein
MSKRETDEQYLDFIREQNCCVPSCGRRGVDPHHIENDGLSRKCSDYDTIPLCRHHHTGMAGYHTWKAGPEAWKKHFNVNPKKLSSKYNSLYTMWLQIRSKRNDNSSRTLKYWTP